MATLIINKKETGDKGMKYLTKIIYYLLMVVVVICGLLGLLFIFSKEFGVGIFFIVDGMILLYVTRKFKQYTENKVALENKTGTSLDVDDEEEYLESKYCINCGEHTKVNKYGRCKKCEQTLVSYLLDEIGTGIEELNAFLGQSNQDQYEQQINNAESLNQKAISLKAKYDKKAVIRMAKTNKYLSSVFEDSKRYLPEQAKNSRSGQVDSFVTLLQNRINRTKNGIISKNERLKKCAEFEDKLENLTKVEINLTKDKYKKLTVGDLEEINYSNVTAQTNYERLGNFVVIDTETTGLSAYNNRIIQASAIRFDDWEPIEIFTTYINPEQSIPEEATKINHITDEMVADAPKYQQIINALNSFVGRSNLVGHNLEFDLKFLYHSGWNVLGEKRKYYDTLKLVKRVLKSANRNYDNDYDVEDYKLVTLCDYYTLRNNKTSAHNACSDALATGFLFKKLVDEKLNR